MLPIKINSELFFPHIYFKNKSYKLYQYIHSIFTCPCYFDPFKSQLALPTTMMPQVMWAQSLLWTLHQHPGRTTGTMSPTGTFLTLGLASFTHFNTAYFISAFRTSCKSHSFHRVEEEVTGYRGLEHTKKEHAWMIPILCWQLGKKGLLSPRQSSQDSLCL